MVASALAPREASARMSADARATRDTRHAPRRDMAPNGARARREVRREGFASEVLSLGSSGQLPLKTPRKFWIFREVTCELLGEDWTLL